MQGSGKTEFLALFLVWYITHLHQNEGRPLLIGVTAFTRHAIMNLLERVSTVRSRHRDTTTSDFHIISMESGKAIHDDMTVCKANDLPEIFAKLHRDAKAVVVGGTVWDWYKVKNKWASWQGCDMMIVDESSQARIPPSKPPFGRNVLTQVFYNLQLLAADAALAIDCLKEEAGRLIIAGDHMVKVWRFQDVGNSVSKSLLFDPSNWDRFCKTCTQNYPSKNHSFLDRFSSA